MVDDIEWTDASISLAAIQTIDEGDYMESSIVAAVRASFPILQAVTWELLRDESLRDIHLLQLIFCFASARLSINSALLV